MCPAFPFIYANADPIVHFAMKAILFSTGSLADLSQLYNCKCFFNCGFVVYTVAYSKYYLFHVVYLLV